MREYIIPNWHAIMIHAPLGLLSVGLALEIITLLWRRSSARVAGRWMILVGAIMAVPAITTGIYAYRDVIDPTSHALEADFSTKWSDLMDQTVKDRIPDATSAGDYQMKEIKVGKLLAGETGKLLKQHILFNSIGLGLVFLAVIAFIGCSDLWRRRLYLPLLLVLMAGEGGIISGAHHGGLTVYQQAAMIKPLPAGNPATEKPTREEQIAAFLPPAQLHFTLAGWMVGFAFVSLALSIRAMTQGPTTPTADEQWMQADRADLAAPMPGSESNYQSAVADADEGITDRDSLAFPPGPEPVTSHERQSVLPRNPSLTIPPQPLPVIPAARFWLLALLAGLATAAAGLWQVHIWKWPDLQSLLKTENRNLYHAILGSSIIVLTLLLAIIARFARRAKFVLATFSLLLLIAIGLQIYMGILMTFDSAKGPKGHLISPFKWNVETPSAAMGTLLP